MAEFKLDRFKYIWKGDWTTGTSYRRDDIVRVNGKSYVALLTHTSSARFADDLYATLPGSNPPQPQPKWVVMTSSRSFIGEWETAVDYNLGDIILYQGTVWSCVTSHTSSVFSADSENWEVFAKGLDFVGDWQSGNDYGHGALVRYGGKVYKCLNAHSAGGILENNIDDWEIFYTGIDYKGQFANDVNYKQDDLVKYGATLFRCIESHTSSNNLFDTTKFVVEFPGSQANGVWDSQTSYEQGDIVRYGGNLYYATANSFDVDPSRESDDSTVSWIILAKVTNFVGEYNVSSVYKTGEITRRGGYLYRAVRDVNRNTGDGSTVDYLDTDIWEIVVPGKTWKNFWTLGDTYYLGDVVYHLGTAYTCNFEHQASNENRPGDNGEPYEYWDILIQAGREGGLHDKGDLLSFGLSRTFTSDESTLGDVRVPIGEKDQILSITDEYEAYWRNIQADTDVVFVNPKGVDAPGNGLTQYTPFRTVRYACEFINDNLSPGTLAKVFVSAGKFEEIGPIIVPAGCVVMGDELRSTTVVASPAIDFYQDKFQYIETWIARINSFVLSLIQNQPVIPTPGNNEPQVFPGGASDLDTAIEINNLMQDYLKYIEFRVNDGIEDPVETGSNDRTTNEARIIAANQLDANREFIAQEILAFLIDENTGITWESKYVLSDVRSLIRGIADDLRYSGNHRTLYASRYWANSYTGGQNDDIFFMRDITGLRNMTTDGLTGNLNPPGVFDLYQRPTGGSCVSLDPGWGPDDERTWIKNRSPYIQGVTNIGQGCTGMKVDGSLHNGGNKSMVANDFTQVLSDGIGAWVSNNARVELVSVFTYYCSVGYLAEDGGIIRATNGNNSYGKFGSIADGNDPAETPQSVSVNNRDNEAQVYQAFAGGSTDRLFAFEYSNAGEEYTTATASIVGAGANASVTFSDFRDGALFNARLVNTKGSGSEGGSNYYVRQGYAQVTADSTTSLLLSATNNIQFEAEVLGARITIISGTGVGQTAIISGYDPVTRELSVIRERDGQPGWEHIIHGTPIVTSLDSTAYYRIEPRIECTAPPFDYTSYPLAIELNHTSIAFGGTTALYNNLLGQPGTAPTFDAVSVTATFRVNRAGNTYTVETINPGAGYAVNDTITLAGNLLGGESPANDIVITVTETSNDSTNSIVDFTFTGTPVAGILVGVSDTSKYITSANGQSYTFGDLPFVGDYVKILAADNRFFGIASNVNTYAYSQTGTSWTTRSLPDTQNWSDATYGNETFVIIGQGTSTFLYSTDGLTFSTTTAPSTANWSKVAYGQGKFVAIANGSNSTLVSTDGITWIAGGNLPSNKTWIGFEFGNNRFLAVASDGYTCFSLDAGATWIVGDLIELGLTTIAYDLAYGQGVFTVLAKDGDLTGGYNTILTTPDGTLWTSRNIGDELNWSVLTFNSFNNKPTFIAIADEVLVGGSLLIETGATAKVRGKINQGSFTDIVILDPGSGYTDASPCEFTVTDSTYVTEVEIDGRIGNGVLSQPEFNNRGEGYRTTTSSITISGDGFADIIPEGNTIKLSGITSVPGPGVQIRITGIFDEDTEDPDDLKLFNGVVVTDLGDDGTGNGTKLIQIQLSPNLQNEYNLSHATNVTLRSRYSQCRISGHDFLDIGTGNFENTNYPDLYAGGNFFVAAPENEVLEANGGRVFYTSTDQDGNFRAGELFAVNQATGVVTISAQFFDLDGLSELALGGVRLGGSGAVVREFSTDPTFSEDSNNVVPTQRAIATFLADRLSVGGENLETNGIVAGKILIGTDENKIENTADEYIYFPTTTIWEGTYDRVDPFGVATPKSTAAQGMMIGQMMLFRDPNNEGMQ